MTLQEFATRFCVTHVAVMKWEKTKNRSTNINWATEKDIRLFVLSKMESESSELTKLYSELEYQPPNKTVSIRLDFEQLAA
jgi:hypothetical protein